MAQALYIYYACAVPSQLVCNEWINGINGMERAIYVNMIYTSEMLSFIFLQYDVIYISPICCHLYFSNMLPFIFLQYCIFM